MNRDPLSEAVIGLAIEVHRTLGPGLLESVYESCHSQELTVAGVPFRKQLAIPVLYKGKQLDIGFRADVVVQGELLIEIESIEKLGPCTRRNCLPTFASSAFGRAY